MNSELPECQFHPKKHDVLMLMSPYQNFLQYFTDDFCDKVCELSNNYLRSKNPNSTFVLDKLLLHQYAGIILKTTLIRLGATKRYWQENSRIDSNANCMSIKTFETITSMLHFEQPKNQGQRTAKFQMIIDQCKWSFWRILCGRKPQHRWTNNWVQRKEIIVATI